MENFEKNKKDDKQPKEKKQIPLISMVFRWWMLILLCAAVAVAGITTALVKFDKVNHGDIVIVLDPGHGGVDVGASNSSLGLYESEINLKIALACRDKLQQYDGVRVYMTHTGVRSQVAKSSLSSRVSVAEEVGADIFISLHINSAESKTAAGAEVYVPMTTHEPKYNEECTKLAENFLANFQALGLGSRGVKTRPSGGGRVYTFEDGTVEKGDYYYVIGEPISRLGIPGMLVEHAFIDGDSDFLDTDEKLEALGNADALAIAKYYSLTLKPEYNGVSSTSSNVASSVSSAPESDVQSDPIESDVSSNEPPAKEDEKDQSVLRVEELIRALSDTPTENDSAKINEARNAFVSLGEDNMNAVDAELYQKLCNVVTAYENTIRPIRFQVREGSEMSIDRINGRLLHAETAMQQSGKITTFSLMLELELFIDPDVPDEYREDGILTYRITAPDGTEIGHDDVISDGSVISVLYKDLLLDSLKVSIEA